MIQENKIILHQRKIILKIIQDFKEVIKDIKFKFYPMENLIKFHGPNEDSNKLLSTIEQERYQSVVGYLFK